MHWRKLIEGCELYRQQAGPRYDRAYDKYVRKHGGNPLPAPQGFDGSHAQDLIDFMNAWGARAPIQAAQLTAAYPQVYGSLCQLAALRLDNVILDQPLATGHTPSALAAQVFDGIAKCGTRNEYPVGASKMLHALVPHFFVMWDNSIAAGYACPTSGHGYAFTFLPRLMKELEEAIVTCAREYVANRREATAALVKLGGRRPLPKLLDEFNYAKYTLSLSQLWDRV